MTATPPRNSPRLFDRGSWPEARRIGDILRKETIGGVLLLAGAVLALIWANSPWGDSYETLRGFTIGPASLHLDLSLATWAADGLLAIFFFVAGLELKREFVAGDLRDPRRAAVPIAAAVGGVLVPAVLYLAINVSADDGAVKGWAIPTATDIAFALAVLAVIGRCLPHAMRTFLLTLAVVDDLLAIVIIAVFYTSDLSVLPLLGALAPLAVFTVLVQRRVRAWWLLLPLAFATWTLMHASGIHATVAGVLLGFAVPVLRSRQAGGPDAGPGMAEHFEHRFRPISAGVAVPVFAFMSAGVAVGGPDGLGSALTDPVAVGILVGLIVGKPVGITAATWLVTRFTRAKMDSGFAWIDVFGLAVLAGIGFTVSLLIGELAFGVGSDRDDHVKVAVLTGSLGAALLATVILRLRNRTYRRIHEAENTDADRDDIPDVYQQSEPGRPENA
ncbi:putative sodium/proton antiporter [Actinoplanes missouriensis 431]|uniref:Na(+)/H(+) antiporter NhaA n=1 Tax=Actinoplanes missouriensis (strain ATCC 14538 / DSM 43046 / CBS 188.64 / JCM 3121 / NBRC 102363 / NCIMB 12654 / NRRL B-3342 / UNCC 431) TaxID=512565 RepID=I0H5D2_ACTM4|nr:Na+/H+ antiporter NhaA [Actinoplanes missouriensis]BAL88219.1 putative sodium/proton antiporter [Actinoplanes missouriensis 431]